jgi:branched-chain amino acid transport system substrate-binding protein
MRPDPRKALSSRRTLAAAAVAFLAAATVAACSAPGGSSSAASGGGSSSAKSPIIVAVTGQNSGAEYAPGPASAYNQQKAIIDAWNAAGGIDGHPLEMKFFDTQSSAATAATLVPQIKSSGAKVAMVCCFPAEVGAITAGLASSGPLTFIIPPPVPTPANSFIFDATPPPSAGVTATAKFIGLKGWKNIALITDTTPEGLAGPAIIADGKQYGYTVTTHQVFDTSATSVSTQVSKIAAAKPDAIVLYSTGPQVATVFNGLLAAGLKNTPVVMEMGNLNLTNMASYVNAFPNYVYVPADKYLASQAALTGTQDTVLKAFLKEEGFTGTQNDNVAGLALDNYAVFVNALTKLGVNASESALKNYVQNLKDFQGIDGTYNFSASDHHGVSGNDMAFVQIVVNGKALSTKLVANSGITQLVS